MKILAIETSCDETSASVVEKENGTINVISNITATSLAMHSSTGGIVPENAAREQVRYILPTITQALNKASDIKRGDKLKNPHEWTNAKLYLKNEIDAIAVTYGPGLIGSLLVGVETAKTLSYVFKKPIIPINHLLAHIYGNYIQTPNFKLPTSIFPFIGLIISGGHTDLLLFKSHDNYKWLGGTRDDAAGEALDKTGRLLDLSYPAGPEIERHASQVLKTDLKFKSPLIHEDTYDFSFSGLKTEVARFVKNNVILRLARVQSTHLIQDPIEIADRVRNNKGKTIYEVCYAIQKAVIDVLIDKTLKAAEEYNCKTILVGGGVSANQTFIEQLKLNAKRLTLNPKIFSPEKIYCTDNAAMIGVYALINGRETNWQNIKANPELYFS